MVDRRLAVGFADLVGFTRLTRRLEEEELGELVESFETTAADLVAAHGGRLIKTLGDEVLFAADDAGTAAEIALRLIEAMSQDETMPALRVGIAFGTVTTRMGDVFGTTVNLASRLTSIAPKDAVLVDGAFAKELVRHGDAPESEAQAAEEVAAAAERARLAEKEGREPVDQPPLPTYRFGLQPMWQRPVRGLGVVEPWLLARRGKTGS
jgi:adenylate cyclase